MLRVNELEKNSFTEPSEVINRNELISMDSDTSLPKCPIEV